MNQPAGWYPDPGDPSLVRYWDGTGWSPRTAPKFSPSTSPHGGRNRLRSRRRTPS
ncbi:MAG: DUF2510 domain-containing protein [Rhodococcus sp. (in: high G+C Gram-positive bacteria)]|nr:DUF2510 domain-containing protein [Rhodococcus sp. (in: high G+C Gram-positive bacteria)]MDX5454221.1 DUF2510 domain-containing protein [Rhodococcus sp. (in: high G+C Gram-positive bacteria)]